MKSYKDFDKRVIGSSDIATLIFVGYNREVGDLVLKGIHFGGDDSYQAYIVDKDANIGEHYELVAEFNSWLKVYDDYGLTERFDANEIKVYRSGERGCIIQLVNK